MKRYGNLFRKVCSLDNLKCAAENARKGKGRQQTVKEFYSDFENNILKLHDELVTRSYEVSPYNLFVKYEPKKRVLYKLPFRDRIVQWAIMNVIVNIWEAQIPFCSFSCVRGRGTHYAKRKMQRAMRRDPDGTRYSLKLDIEKFYPSIDHDILKVVIRKKIKDPDLLWLLDTIIDSVRKNEGVPIGNYISQYFANLYLTELDHLLKEEYRVKYYFRYADDMALFASSKAELDGYLVFINHYLQSERRLSIKGNFQKFPVSSRGVDFVGYVTYHEYSRARKINKKNLCRKLANLRRANVPEEEIRIKVASRIGFMKHCNSNHFLKTVGMKKFSDIAKG